LIDSNNTLRDIGVIANYLLHTCTGQQWSQCSTHPSKCNR